MDYRRKKLAEIINNRNVLFITTKKIDYIRNTQEIRILKDLASNVEIISSNREHCFFRVLSVWKKIKKAAVRRNDVIFVSFAPQLIIPFVGIKLKGKPLIIDFFISVYDTLICDRKKFKDGSLAAKVFHKLDEYTINKANHVITDTKAHADYFCSEFGADADFLETIYLEADSTIYYPRIQNKTETLKDKFIVLYFGSMLPLQGVDVVFDAIRELKDKDNIYFDIIGPVSPKYNKPIQENVSYTDWLSQKELAEHIANADLCLAGHFNIENDKAKRTIPGKAFIYEAMKKPIIFGDNQANRELFSEDDSHSFVEMGAPHKLASMIVDKHRRYGWRS